MEKPQPKREVAIITISKSGSHITFHASADAIEDFKDFGRIEPDRDFYWLWVDTRYNFDEILEYIKGYE